MQKLKRFLAGALAVSMLMGMMAVSAFAAEDTGDTYVNPYIDVFDGDWYYNEVKYVTENKLMNGMAPTEFAPTRNTTRGMVATILYRMDGEPQVAVDIEPFTDLVQDWYVTPVEWAYLNGIVGGRGEGLFCPEDDVTREELVTMIQRYVGSKNLDVSQEADLSGFADVDTISEYAVATMAWSVDVGLISGRSANELAPKAKATRAEVATILYRLRENVLPNAEEVELDENDTPLSEGPVLPNIPNIPIGGHTTHTGRYASNGSESHNIYCIEGGELLIANQAHSFSSVTGACILCGEQHATHTSHRYVSNGSETHNVYCAVGGELLDANVPHTFVNGTCLCGALEPAAPEVTDPIANAIAASVADVNSFSKPYLNVQSGDKLDLEIALAASGEKRDATVTANVKAESVEGLTDSVLAVATIYAYKVLGLGTIPADENAAVEELKDIVKPILEEMDISWNNGKIQLLKDIAKAILADGKAEAKDIWSNFRDADGYLFETATISSEGTVIATISTAGGRVTVNGGRNLDTISGKKLAVKTIAKALLESVKTENPTVGSTLKASAELTVSYAGGKAVLADNTNPDSALTCAMNVTSGLFSYGYVNGKHNIAVNLPEDEVQGWINGIMDEVVNGTIDLQAMLNKLKGTSPDAADKMERAIQKVAEKIKNTSVPAVSQTAFGNNFTIKLNGTTIGQLLSAPTGTEFSGVLVNDNSPVTLTITSNPVAGTDLFATENLLKLLNGKMNAVVGVEAEIKMNSVTITVPKNVDLVAQIRELWDNGSSSLMADRDALMSDLLNACTVGQVIEIAKSTRYADKVEKVESLLNRIQGHVSVELRNMTVADLMNGVDAELTYRSYTEMVNMKLVLK